MLDPDTGKQIGPAFQPTISAGERPVWMNPVLLNDKQSVVIADQKRNLYKISTGKQLRLLPDLLPLVEGRLGRAVLLPKSAFVAGTLLPEKRRPAALKKMRKLVNY